MRHPIPLALCLAGGVALSGCTGGTDADASRALQDMNVVDESNLSEIMLTVADPDEAVNYFRNALDNAPDRADLRRGLARSLVRAGRAETSLPVWRELLAQQEATAEDRVDYAGALIRTNDWAEARAVLDEVPPTHETYQRYRLEAMVADADEDWERADSFYEIAAGLTNNPSGVLNNWGYSKLSRGEHAAAEDLFIEALTYDPELFTAKNNLVLARAAQRNYDLPLIDMTQTERARLLHTMALAAIRLGDVNIGRGLLQEAIDTHPQHFEPAARALRALESNVANG
ncbi:hypothetical protein C2I36_03950 [Rhodobacteraceae bacterium WD3A24]|nr:hypothetical protein C2I36_03950 [Rhodobacteraceae bacterium WD3A24]